MEKIKSDQAGIVTKLEQLIRETENFIIAILQENDSRKFRKVMNKYQVRSRVIIGGAPCPSCGPDILWFQIVRY